jgi:hypothetical protein
MNGSMSATPMATSLGDKVGASMINVSLLVFVSLPLYALMPDVNSWRFACVLTFLIYNLAVRKRCLGMRLMGTYIHPPSSIPYVAAYAAGFASIIYYIWLPFDLLLLNSAAQLTSILRTGNTLHGWLTGSETTTKPNSDLPQRTP